jgi:hypothetical protein
VYSNLRIDKIPPVDGKEAVFGKLDELAGGVRNDMPRSWISSPTPRVVLQPESNALEALTEAEF